MKREKVIKKTKRLVAVMLAAIVIMESSLNGVFVKNVYAQEQNELSSSTQAESDIERIFPTGSAYKTNTETKKVAVDETSIAQTKIYKDMDYSFLKNYEFGKSNADLATVTFGTAQELMKSKDIRLVSGRIIRTEGYYEVGDNGSAVYEILSEYDMGKAKRTEGAIKLTNGLYACIIPDIYEISGEKWMLVNVLQYGAKGDGVVPSHYSISTAFTSVSKHVAQDDDGDDLGEVVRGIAYIPAGEYKCANEVGTSYLKNINIVGEGDSSVLFTDNDYRAGIGYGEFFFSTWNANNIYYGDFRIEAREVDLYHYMRQFVLIYCDNIYINNVDLIIPQESWSGYYYEDKQYSNFTCYSGNTNVTVDGCIFVLFSGTYRGANVGIMDFWNREVKNITVMNCDLYSNARDEQIGIFNIPKTGSTVNENTSISNVDLINNTIHTTPVKYEEVVGNQNMCFTISYSDSVRIDDVRIAGNHFICEADSKFMTFGNLTNCVVEENIIEIITTRNTGASVFDSSNGDANNILIRNNEFFITSKEGNRKKAGMTQGKMTLEGNRIFSECGMTFGVVGQIAKNNEFVFLKRVGFAASGVNSVESNIFYLYEGAGGGNCNGIFDLSPANGVKEVFIKNNIIYDYSCVIGRRTGAQALVNVVGADGKERAEFSGNTYYAPNRKYISADRYETEDSERADVDWYTDGSGKMQITAYYNRMFYMRVPDDKSTCKLKNLVFENNTMQGVKGYTHWNNGSSAEDRTVQYTLKNNTTLPYNENLSEDNLLVSNIDILHNNKKVTEIAVTGNSVDLSKVVKVATRDEDGSILEENVVTDKEIKWYTSVESMATISDNGKVTRHMYGDVKVYAVATDGSGVYGECTIRFLKKRATGLSFEKKNVDLQPGLKYYTEYAVLPESEASQNLRWTSSNENVATVSDTGFIKGISVGKAIITATTTDGSNLSATLTVNVTPITVKKMSMDTKWLYYTQSQIGSKKQLAIKYYTPDNATNKSVKRWESLDTSVATVDANGMVTIVGSGRAEIRAYSTDEYCYTNCFVFVEPDQVKNFKATSVYQNKVDLSWDAVEKSYGYYLYQWDFSTSSWTVLNSGKALDQNKTSYTVSNLESDTEYRFCVRSYYRNYLDSNGVYESKDAIVNIKTYSYNPVTYIKGGSDIFTIVDHSWVEKKGTFDLKYNSDANYENLQFDYKIADESIVKIVSVEDTETGKKKITLEGVKYGHTTLTITANDAWHTSVDIPIGFITAKQVSNCNAEAVYKKVDISFNGLEDESSIDGYLVCSMVTLYKYNIVSYIPKTGVTSYNAVDKNVIVGKEYNYKIYPCLTDGTNYYLGCDYNNKTVKIPEPIKATSLKMGKAEYIVTDGESIEVSANIVNDDATTHELYWEIINEDCASIERMEKTDGQFLTDYAKITSIDTGVTKIKAVTTDGSDLEISAKLIVVPTTVKDLRAEANLNNVSLKWSEIKNADGYIIYRWDENQKEFQQIAQVKETYFKDMKLEGNISYRYRIAAYIEADGVKYNGNYSPEITVATASNNYGIYATGYLGTYDGTSHEAVTLNGIKKNTDTVTYSTDRNNWSTKVPIVTDVKDSGNVYIKVEREGHKKPYEITVVATVMPASVESMDIKLKKYTEEWNGKKHTPKVVSKTCILNKDYTVSGIKAFKNIGTYTVTIKGIGNYTGTKELTYTINVVKGHKYKISGFIYKITGNNTVSVTGITNKKKTTINIKSTVKIGGKKYKITAIGANAFKNNKKLKQVTIGKNVGKIGTKAFYKCKKLRKIIIKTTKLKSKMVGKKAFLGTPKNVKVKVPKNKVKTYSKIIKDKGIAKSGKVTK